MNNTDEHLTLSVENIRSLRVRCELLETVNCASWISRMALVLLDAFGALTAAYVELEGKYNDPYAPPGGPPPSNAKWHMVDAAGNGLYLLNGQEHQVCMPVINCFTDRWEAVNDIKVEFVASQSYTTVLAQYPWQGSLRPINLPPEF